MAKLLFDTSVYIPLLKDGKAPGSILETQGSILYLSSVVAQELYAGAGDAATSKALDQLCYVFKKNGRLCSPTAENWIQCGRLLSQIGKKFGYESIKKGRLVNDVLISLSCKQIGATLLTTNHKDFQLIRQFLPFQFIGI